MFDYEGFMAKTTVYFARGAESDETSEDQATWLLLGLEFLLRAPLAKVHPTLLAVPEGDSILHAAGIERARGVPRSIPVRTVIDRLTKIDPEFGEDRGKDAIFLMELRNEELHTSRASLASAGYAAWMPRFLNVAEAVCVHLEVELGDLLAPGIVAAAQEYRSTADAQTQGTVQQLRKAALTLFGGLSKSEVSARTELPSPLAGAVPVECPVCEQQSGWLGLSEGRTTEPTFDEDDQVIRYKLIRVVAAFQCTVCNLVLTTPGQVIAAGIDRLFVEDQLEDRYEGWEELMTYDDAISFLGAEEEYGDE